MFPSRIVKMREDFLKIKPSLSLHRAKAFTQVFRENRGLPLILLRAKSIYRTAETLPLFIGEEELIVGHPGGKQRAGIVAPDICFRWIEKELETCSKRQQDPYEISDEDKQILKEEIIPFWRGFSIDEIINAQVVEREIDGLTYRSGLIDCEVKAGSGGCDLSPGYGNILFKKGFGGVKQQALKRLEELSFLKSENIDAIYFYQSVIICCDAMILLGKRYADLARQMAEKVVEPRRSELLKIAQVCEKVPENPPENFHQALQMIWFGQIAIYLEENTSGTSPGRIDQYLFPFWKNDLSENKIDKVDKKEMVDLLYSFLFKFNEIPWPLSEGGSLYFAGYIPFFNIVVGGVDKNGDDATNDLTYEIIDAVKNLKMYQPSLAARIHEFSPDLYLSKIVDLISVGLGFPALHFDQTTIKMLTDQGISLSDARDYCLMGCVEPYVHGKMFRWTSACYTNFPIAVEFALTGGLLRATGEKLGIGSGQSLNQLSTYEEFEKQVFDQLHHIIKVSVAATHIAQRAHRDHLPKPMSSLLVEGCLESGKEIMNGGAFYNLGPGIVMVGLADIANSLMAIKKLVFDDKRLTLEKIDFILSKNFVGFEVEKQLMVDCPKYGNDEDEVDQIARRVLSFTSKTIRNYKGLYAPMDLGTLSITTNIALGKIISALPSGRNAFMPLADGIGPSQGSDLLGPTATIKSVDKLDQVETSVGTLFNMKFSPEILNNEKGRQAVKALIRSHNRLGGAQIQFNCIAKETLLKAQKNPEEYRSLIVRVSGYSAYFTELSTEVQNDIINRSEHNFS